MRRILFILSVPLLLLAGCSKNDLTPPPYHPERNLENTYPVADSIVRSMEGIYTRVSGSDQLGSQFVCKARGKRVTFFSDTEGIFMILKYGWNPEDSSIQFAGFWRYSENALQGTLSFSVSVAGGSMDLILNHVADHLRINGEFMGTDYIIRPLSLAFNRHFSAYTASHEFVIFGHHGIQTTANPPYAENSINAVLNAEHYGMNGIELDVRMTKDHVPICIHDPTINTRLTLKGPISGSWDQYTFPLISNYVRLIDGQRVPSVEEILETFLSDTELKYLWLDVKGNPDIFKYLEPIVRNAYARAAQLNRDVVIITDIPTKAVIEEFKKQPSYATLPTMCEVSLQDCIDNGCTYWGPRYSEGLLLTEVAQAHAMGIKVYSWTLNDRNIIRNYLVNGQFDGFISDYSAYVVYDYYTLF
jgi:glycerophosphoryl diester phosphodiesterase